MKCVTYNYIRLHTRYIHLLKPLRARLVKFLCFEKFGEISFCVVLRITKFSFSTKQHTGRFRVLKTLHTNYIPATYEKHTPLDCVFSGFCANQQKSSRHKFYPATIYTPILSTHINVAARARHRIPPPDRASKPLPTYLFIRGISF